MRTNFKMEDSNITMTKGDSVSFNVIVQDPDNNIIAVDSAYFTCKKLRTDETKVFQKSLNAGIWQDETGLTVRIAPQDTANVDAGLYFYDCQIGVEDDIYTILKGILTIEQDVTD